jgi:hypothetical protein
MNLLEHVVHISYSDNWSEADWSLGHDFTDGHIMQLGDVIVAFSERDSDDSCEGERNFTRELSFVSRTSHAL